MARLSAVACALGVVLVAGVKWPKKQKLNQAVQNSDMTLAEKGPEEICNHLNCRVSNLFKVHMEKTRAQVMSWDIAPAVDTDRVAVTIYQPTRDLELFAYVIKANMHRLGPKWALQIFYGTEADKDELNNAIGSPENVIWTPIAFNGTRKDSINKNEANWFRLTMNFWDPIPKQYENVLIFESDSLVLRKDCVDSFIGYDLVGAPWKEGDSWGRMTAPLEGGNGGFTLRTRSAGVDVVKHRMNKDSRLSNPATFDRHEDGEMMFIMKRLTGMHHGKGPLFPPREDAMQFAVEKIFSPTPCGFHNPWEFLTATEAKTLLEGAEFD